MDKINRYFFPLEDDEELHPSDAIWFYGILASMVATTIFTVMNVS